MTTKRLSSVPFLLVVMAGCGAGTSVDFGAPKTLSKADRPTVWDASTKERLAVPDMRAPQDAQGGKGEKRWSGDTPAGWESLPANPARFRDAVWRVANEPDTDCYFTAGVGGGVVGNLTRWYSQQFGVKEVPAMEALPVIELAGKPGRLAEIKGTFNQKPDWAALIAFVAQGEQVASLKFTGPEKVVTANREKFLALAKSLRVATASPDPKAPPIERGQPMPKDHPPVPGADPHGATPQAPAAAPFTATVPAGWTAKAGSGRPLHHTFGTDGEVYLSQLGGNLRGHLDIWRSEVGQKAMTDAEWNGLAKVPMLGGEAYLLDASGDLRSMTGKQVQGARLLVAAQAQGNTITFVKLVGKAAEVETQREAFLKFCESLRRAQ